MASIQVSLLLDSSLPAAAHPGVWRGCGLCRRRTLLANDSGNAKGQEHGAILPGDHEGRPYYGTDEAALQARP